MYTLRERVKDNFCQKHPPHNPAPAPNAHDKLKVKQNTYLIKMASEGRKDSSVI